MRKADNLPPYCAVVKKSRSLNLLDPSGPPMACNGRALPLSLPKQIHSASVGENTKKNYSNKMHGTTMKEKKHSILSVPGIMSNQERKTLFSSL